MAVLRCPTCHREFEQGYLKCPYDGAALVDPGAGGDPFIGRQLADTYQLVRRIGAGGMGSVYEARHIRLQTSFAVKLLRPELAISEEMLARFHREARSASQLKHPNIIQVIDVNNTQDRIHYIIQEYLAGEPLADLLNREKVLDVEQAVPLLVQVCDAMKAAHDKGIVHRDIKPENIFLVKREGRPDLVKVLDFGIAKMQQSDDTKLTRESTAMGTPDYISPEQAESADAVDFRSDIYSFGVVIYRAFTGRLPYEIENPLVALDAVRIKDPVPPRERRADLPEAVEAVILRSMQRSPEDRHGSMLELKEALETLLVQKEQIQIAPTIHSHDADPSVPRTVAAAVTPASTPVPTPAPASTPAPVGTPAPAPADVPATAAPTDAPSQPPPGGLPTPVPVGQMQPVTAMQKPRKNALPLIALIGVVVLGGGGTAAYFLTRQAPKPPKKIATTEPAPPDAGAKQTGQTGSVPGGGVIETADTPADAAPAPPPPASPKEMQRIRGGSFTMGRAKGGHAWEQPAHKCTVKDFYLDVDEVTRSEFAAFLDSPAGKSLRTKKPWRTFKVTAADGDLPVTKVTWAEADKYCRSEAGRRLPTENEWEYAARGPLHDALYPTGAKPPGADVAHHSRKGKKVDGPRKRSEPVGGISDLIGNVGEWVQDHFKRYSSDCNRRKPPQRRGYAKLRVIRGGGFDDADPNHLTATFRIPQDPVRFRWKSVGFRCARSKSGDAPSR